MTRTATTTLSGWSTGATLRKVAPRRSHGEWSPPADRPDPVGPVTSQAQARAHARSGDPALITDHVGSGDDFDLAMGDFAVAYADQSERDFAAFTAAIRDGSIPAHE